MIPVAQAVQPEKTKPYECTACARRFTSAPGLSRHNAHSCALRTAAAPTPAVESRLTQIEKHLATLCLDNIATPRNTYNFNTFNVTLNVFGAESTTHITADRIRALFDEATSQGADTLFDNAAALIFSDYDHPQNLTAFIPDAHQNGVMVYRGLGATGESSSGWEMVPLDSVAPPMVKRTLDLLHVRQPFEPGNHTLESYAELLQQIYNREDVYATGRRGNLRAMLVRNRDMCRAAFDG